MKAHIIKDRKGEPVSVLVDYQEWLQIDQQLTRVQEKMDAPGNPLDWYTLTETTNSFLRSLLV